MKTSRSRLAAILEALGVPPSARRNAATPAAPKCESLEGRQLLTGGMGLGLSGLDIPGLGLGAGAADVSNMGAGGYGAVGQGTGVSSTASPQLQADQMKLQTDTQMIQDQSMVTPAMTSAVMADVKAVKSSETTLPNSAFVANLQAATKAVDAVPGGPTIGQAFGLEIDQNVVYLSQGASVASINQLDADELTVMMATGITAGEEMTLAADHAAVTADQAKATPLVFNSATTATATATPTPIAGSTTVPTAMTNVSFGHFPIAGNQQGVAGSTGVMGELQAAGAGVLVSSPMGGAGFAAIGGADAWEMGSLTALTPTPTPTAAMTTVIADQATLKTDSATLQAAIQTVQTTSNVTPVMEAVVRNDLSAVHGAASVAPSAAALATLKADMTTAMTNVGGPTAAQTAQVQTDKDAIYEGEGVNPKLVATLDTAEAAIVTASGISSAEEGVIYAAQATVKADITKLATDVAAATPPTTTTTTTTPATPAGWMANGGGFGQGNPGFPI